MSLDVQTLAVLSILLPLGMGLLMGGYLKDRKVYPGFSRWVLANFLFCLSFLLISLREVVPAFLSIIVGNGLLLYSEILVFEGIELFFGRRAFRLSNYLLWAVYILVQFYFTYIDPNINLRVVWISILLVILISRSGLALLHYTIPQLGKIANTTAALFFFTALSPLARTFYALQQPCPIEMMSDNAGAWIAVGMIAAVVAWTFQFFFLNSARLEMELLDAREEMTQLAATDTLTELHNRRHFLEHGKWEFERAKREKQTFCIFFIDLDNLKKINDQFGHEAGDTAILQVAKILKSEVRPYDLAARFGGDEFTLLLCNVNREQAVLIAERIRATAAQCPITAQMQEIAVQISVGVTALLPADLELKEVLQRADSALYRAKKEGRNRVAFG